MTEPTPSTPNRLPHQIVDEIVSSNPRVAPRARVSRRARRALAWRNPATPWWRTYTRLRPPEFILAAAVVLGCCLLLAILSGHLTPARALIGLITVYIPGTFLALAVVCLGLIGHAALTALTARRLLRTATENALHDRRQLRDMLATLGIRDPASLAVVLRLAAASPLNTTTQRGRLLHLAHAADPTGRYAPVHLPTEPDPELDPTTPESTSDEVEKVKPDPDTTPDDQQEQLDNDDNGTDRAIPAARAAADDDEPAHPDTPAPQATPEPTMRYPE